MQCFPRLKQRERELTFKRNIMCQLAARPTQRGVASIKRGQRTGLHFVHTQKDVARSIQRDVAHTGVQLVVEMGNSCSNCGFGGSEVRDRRAGASRRLRSKLASALIPHWPFSGPPICIREFLFMVGIRCWSNTTFPVDHSKFTSNTSNIPNCTTVNQTLIWQQALQKAFNLILSQTMIVFSWFIRILTALPHTRLT